VNVRLLVAQYGDIDSVDHQRSTHPAAQQLNVSHEETCYVFGHIFEVFEMLVEREYEASWESSVVV